MKNMVDINKRGYNPFKMIGSWIGLILFLILSILPFILINLNKLDITNPISRILFYYIMIIAILFKLIGIDTLSQGSFGFGFLPGSPTKFGIVLIIILSAIIGFIIGWLVHSLIKYIKNKK